jgi:phage-related protein
LNPLRPSHRSARKSLIQHQRCSILADAVLIFHAFAKKTQKTPDREIVLGKKRLKEML